MIGFPAGGPLDQHARLLTDKLQAVLGQPVVVDYKSGAGGTVGAQDVMKAPPDGHTLMLANTGVMVINPALYRRLPYQTLKDFTPIARTAMQPLALLVNPKLPAQTLPEFIQYARAKPGQVNFGSAGNGGISHLVPEMFKTATGLFMVHIPYRGSAPAFTDLMAGQVQFMAESIPQAAAYHKQGKVRALAVTSRQRNPALPDVPTAIERAQGLRGGGLLRFSRAGRHAQGRGRQAERCVRPGAAIARGARAHGVAGRRSGLPGRGCLRGLPRHRDAALGHGRGAVGREAGLRHSSPIGLQRIFH